jgi:hypothetical protein
LDCGLIAIQTPEAKQTAIKDKIENSES